jgi:hypothetical protein
MSQRQTAICAAMQPKEAPGRFLAHPGAPDSLRDTWEPAVRRECEDTGSAYVPTTGACTPQFPEGQGNDARGAYHGIDTIAPRAWGV